MFIHVALNPKPPYLMRQTLVVPQKMCSQSFLAHMRRYGSGFRV